MLDPRDPFVSRPTTLLIALLGGCAPAPDDEGGTSGSPSVDTDTPTTMNPDPSEGPSGSSTSSPGTSEGPESSDGSESGEVGESTGEPVDPPDPPMGCPDANPTIEALAPGTWLEVAAPLETEFPTGAVLEEIHGNTGPRSIMAAWCGGAFDTIRDRLIVTGGGHWDYAGNEVYAFALESLTWERLNEPSSMAGWSSGDDVMPDGTPPSRHTYGGILYLPPPIDRLWISGGAIYGPGNTSPRTWLFDFGTLAWTEVATSPIAGEATAVFDAERGRVYSNFNYHGLATHDVVADSWSITQEYSEVETLYRTTAYDPVRSQIVTVGQGEIVRCDVADAGDITCDAPTSAGQPGIEGAGPVGFVYAEGRDRFYGWSGGSMVYVLNPDTLQWTVENGDGPTPTEAEGNGTYGRWRYSPCHDVFVGVNRTDEPVYLYRPRGGAE